ncbi:hypothetical protein L6164_025921 [Bauhinia variegata]|uniref:Uncharacterized protein n=1 Tax=Bauhinia variegata TaxID=167791 RepID=A0ACB9M2B4_BAUVA|nr:hypothetical protein L6164_025921 [Bauhinia variegata]
MAERAAILHKKLKKLTREVSEQEISQHLFELALEFEKARELLSGDTDWRRNGNDALEGAISRILDVVEDVEEVADLFLDSGQSISIKRRSEISSKMRLFPHKDPSAGKVLAFALSQMSRVVELFTGPSFQDMLKNFSHQVRNHLEKLLWHMQITLAIGRSDFNPLVQFIKESDGWVNIEFDLGGEESSLTSTDELDVWENMEFDLDEDCEVTSLTGSEGEITEFLDVKV